jgi:F0F1-type ATP synthase assembly protein I
VTSQTHQPSAPRAFAKRTEVPKWRKNRDRLDGMSLSIEMAGSVVLGWYLGKLFDDHFLTGPWGMMFFVLAGVIAASKAILRFYRQAKQVMAQKEPGVEVAEHIDADARRREAAPEVTP